MHVSPISECFRRCLNNDLSPNDPGYFIVPNHRPSRPDPTATMASAVFFLDLKGKAKLSASPLSQTPSSDNFPDPPSPKL